MASVADPAVVPFDGSLLGVSCTSVSGVGVRTTSTTVGAGQGLTYRMFNRLLDQLDADSRWTTTQTLHAPGAEPGFLTALRRLLTRQLRSEPVSAPMAPVAYVYNNTVYDLTLVEAQPLSEATDGHPCRACTRSDFRIRNRSRGTVTRFSVTFTTDGDGVAVPVQILYQPNWWLRIELHLDDDADVPPDPATDRVSLDRIRHVCATARAIGP